LVSRHESLADMSGLFSEGSREFTVQTYRIDLKVRVNSAACIPKCRHRGTRFGMRLRFQPVVLGFPFPPFVPADHVNPVGPTELEEILRVRSS
jgi:hypothetical protein